MVSYTEIEYDVIEIMSRRDDGKEQIAAGIPTAQEYQGCKVPSTRHIGGNRDAAVPM